MDQVTTSIWETRQKHQSEIEKRRRKGPLREEIEADVCIVGAGITGLTAAYLLSQQGRRVVVLEARKVASGTSGKTSAHLDPRSDAHLHKLLKTYGFDTARKVLDAGLMSVNVIEDIVHRLHLDTGFRRVPGILYTESDEHVSILEQEMEAADELGVDCRWLRDTELPFPVKGALEFNIQAQIEPVQYLDSLASYLSDVQGCTVYENTRVLDIKNGQPCIVNTEKGRVLAQNVIQATHYPIGMMLTLQTRVFPYRSYMLGVRVKNSLSEKLWWDTNSPYHYLRKTHDDRGEVLLVGGADHKTGHQDHTEQCFSHLENYVRSRFEVEEIPYRWSSQFYEPADMLPYIGQVPMTKHVYVATGFSGTGLTYGTAAASIIVDTILKRDNPLKSIFSPSRIQARVSAKSILKENFHVAEHFFRDRLVSTDDEKFSGIDRGSGKIVAVEGEKFAVFRDDSGELYVLSPVCTHAKCIVHWNSAEKTWDCPCHGGRYTAKGEVLVGPPLDDLERIPLSEDYQEDVEDVPLRRPTGVGPDISQPSMP